MDHRGGSVIPAQIEPLSRVLVQHEIALCVLFGSRARGEQSARSDRDVGVLRRDGVALTLRQLGALQLDLTEVMPDAVLDVVDLATADVLLRMEVARDGVVLFADPPELWAELVARTLIERDDLGPWLEACIRGVGLAARARQSA